jgi:hypothetical protein
MGQVPPEALLLLPAVPAKFRDKNTTFTAQLNCRQHRHTVFQH